MRVSSTASAAATGGGRSGHTRGSDGFVDHDPARSKWAALVARAIRGTSLLPGAPAVFALRSRSSPARSGHRLPMRRSPLTLRFGPNDAGAFGLDVALEIEMAGVDQIRPPLRPSPRPPEVSSLFRRSPRRHHGHRGHRHGLVVGPSSPRDQRPVRCAGAVATKRQVANVACDRAPSTGTNHMQRCEMMQ